MASENSKRYHVTVAVQAGDGRTITCPLRADLTPGAIPDGSTTRYQARKILRRARRVWPDARLGYHRSL